MGVADLLFYTDRRLSSTCLSWCQNWFACPRAFRLVSRICLVLRRYWIAWCFFGSPSLRERCYQNLVERCLLICLRHRWFDDPHRRQVGLHDIVEFECWIPAELLKEWQFCRSSMDVRSLQLLRVDCLDWGGAYVWSDPWNNDWNYRFMIAIARIWLATQRCTCTFNRQNMRCQTERNLCSSWKR